MKFGGQASDKRWDYRVYSSINIFKAMWLNIHMQSLTFYALFDH